MKKVFVLCVSSLLLICSLYFVGSGFIVREDVFLVDYIVPPNQNEMTIAVGVASSAGYTRAVKNVSDDTTRMELQFYSAFGGINGSIGANNRFVIRFPAECKEIYFWRHGAPELMLQRNEENGAWEKAS